MNALSNVLDDVKYNNGLQDAEAPDPKRKFSSVTDAERGAQLGGLVGYCVRFDDCSCACHSRCGL